MAYDEDCMKKAIYTVVYTLLYLCLFVKISSAQVTMTGSPTAPVVGASENFSQCDLCGYCVDNTGRAIAPPPSNWQSCRDCLYPQLKGPAESNVTLKGVPQPDQNHYYTMLGCLSTQPAEFAGQITRVFFALVGGIAFLFLLYGAGIIATSQANPERLNYGKRVVYASLTGLFFVLFSTFIIRFIAVDLLKIPGFGGG